MKKILFILIIALFASNVLAHEIWIGLGTSRSTMSMSNDNEYFLNGDSTHIEYEHAFEFGLLLGGSYRSYKTNDNICYSILCFDYQTAWAITSFDIGYRWEFETWNLDFQYFYGPASLTFASSKLNRSNTVSGNSDGLDIEFEWDLESISLGGRITVGTGTYTNSYGTKWTAPSAVQFIIGKRF